MNQLRELIEARSSQKRTEPGDSRITAPGLTYAAVGPVVHAHRSEFPDLDGPAVQSTASLPKQYGRPAGDQNRRRDTSMSGSPERNRYRADLFDPLEKWRRRKRRSEEVIAEVKLAYAQSQSTSEDSREPSYSTARPRAAGQGLDAPPS